MISHPFSLERTNMAVDSEQFKQALAQWSSGVTVVTTLNQDLWKGTTASSFSSVSLEPPLVMICLSKKLFTHQCVVDSGVFAVNILSREQVDIGKRFAGMFPEIEDRFADLNCITAETGSPILSDVMSWVDCSTEKTVDAGDHTIFIGKVLACGTTTAQKPLLYHHRHWGQFTELL